MLTILHLDDDALFLHRCSLSFRTSPHVAHIKHETANTAENFKEKLDDLKPEGVLLDLSFGGAALKGLEVLRDIRGQGYNGVVIVMSTLSSSDVILECIRAGANDFLSKGLDESELTFRIARLFQGARSGYKPQGERAPLPPHVSGRAMRDIQQRLNRVIRSPIRSLLVTGESGTGKEMVAETLRFLLPVGHPFISVNCAALSTNLLEAEIFGHDKGAFTGASQNKIGLYEAADGGWIFLDEVARLNSAAQAALLRALENGEVRPVGSTRTKKVNVRVIAATNEPLDHLVEKGEFRADLLSRLRGYEIVLPPLRARNHLERQEIVETLLDRLNSSLPVESKEYRLTSSCLSVLCDLPWEQGNIRELWQTIQAMSVDANDGVLSLQYLPTRLLQLKNKSGEKSSKNIKTSVSNNEIPTSSGAPGVDAIEPLAGKLQHLSAPSFPLNFENLVDDIFEYLLETLRIQTGENSPSQRTVAQMFNISRHEAAQRLARAGKNTQ